MKSLIPWKQRNRQMADFRKDFDDVMDRFFNRAIKFKKKGGYSHDIQTTFLFTNLGF